MKFKYKLYATVQQTIHVLYARLEARESFSIDHYSPSFKGLLVHQILMITRRRTRHFSVHWCHATLFPNATKLYSTMSKQYHYMLRKLEKI